MKLSTIETPAVPHKKFAWLPVVVFDRVSGTASVVWLEFVMRRMVSVAGHIVWSYSKCED